MKYKIFALLVTEGKRDLTKTLESIEKQSKKVDHIFIASEIHLKSKFDVIKNNYEKGLARNTMNALIKIKLFYPNEKIFIATIDDDDYWKEDYIYEVSKKIDLDFNFISAYLDVYINSKFKEIRKIQQDELNWKTFIWDNPGIQGSNKVFDLNIALESGGMPKHINSATDRCFNINLLRHPEIKPIIIEKSLCIYNQDKNRDRISNKQNKQDELEKFYRHFENFLNDDLIEKINKRHEKLHNIKKVIWWR